MSKLTTVLNHAIYLLVNEAALPLSRSAASKNGEDILKRLYLNDTIRFDVSNCGPFHLINFEPSSLIVRLGSE
jgi:hypothetical protein